MFNKVGSLMKMKLCMDLAGLFTREEEAWQYKHRKRDAQVEEHQC